MGASWWLRSDGVMLQVLGSTGCSIRSLLVVACLLLASSYAQGPEGLTPPIDSECEIFDRPVTLQYRFGEYSVEAYQFVSGGLGVEQTLTLAGARLWFPDGTSWCWWWDGDKYVTVQPSWDFPVGADLNGNGIPDLLVQRRTHANTCDHHAYLIELGDPPRILYRAESASWSEVYESERGFLFCPVRVVNLEGWGTVHQLITNDRSFGPRLEEDVVACPSPILPVVYTPDETGLYVVADPFGEQRNIHPAVHKRAFGDHLGWSFLDYSTALVEGDPERMVCAAFSIAMTLLYMGEDEAQMRLTVQALVPEDRVEDVWRSAVARAASSNLVGHRFRSGLTGNQ